MILVTQKKLLLKKLQILNHFFHYIEGFFVPTLESC